MADTDGDGVGNNADTDDDNDGLFDSEEEVLGTDPLVPDTDDDGVSDQQDDFPLIELTFDLDGDGLNPKLTLMTMETVNSMSTNWRVAPILRMQILVR